MSETLIVANGNEPAPTQDVPTAIMASTFMTVGDALQQEPSSALMTVGTALQAEPSAGSAVGTPIHQTPSPSPSAAMNQTMMEKTAQHELNENTPRNLCIAVGALLVICMLMAHPRFLARLFASVHRKAAARAEAAARPSYAFDMDHAQKAASAKVQPRVVAGGDLTKGWFLRAGRRGRHSAAVSTYAPGTTPDADPFAAPDSAGASVRCPRAALAPPPHITPMSHKLPGARWLAMAPFCRFPRPLSSRADGTSLLIIAVYIALIGIAMTYKSNVSKPAKGSGYGEDFQRTGMVAMCQIPLVVALGVRNNIIGLCVGKGYDRLRIFHKIVGRVVCLASVLHSAFYIQKWAVANKLAMMSTKPIAITGFVAFAGAVVIAITSLPSIRRRMYGTFEACHYIGIIMMLAGMAAHVPVAVPWSIAAGGVYLVSIFFSLTKTRIAHADLVALAGCTTTLITIPGITTGWRAGQHVKLRVVANGLRRTIESHPLTIASAPDCGGLVLMCKAAGDWSTDLYRLASSGGERIDAEVGVWKRRVLVTVEGPYGGTGHTLTPSFSSVLLIAGGSGISHSLALASDLITRSPSGVVRARTIDLVWVVRVQQTARALIPTIQGLVEQARKWEQTALDGRRNGADLAPPTALRVHIFVTRVPHSSPLTLVPRNYESELREKGSKLNPSSDHGHGHGDKFGSQSTLAHSDDSHHSQGSNNSSMEYLAYLPSEGHDWDGYDNSNHGHNAPTAPVRAALSVDTSAAEKTKADWLQRNPSKAAIARIRSRRTNPDEPMSGIKAYRGRPDLVSVLASVTDETMSRHGRAMTEPSGVFVSACGPEFMVNDARDATRNVLNWKRKAVGGVEFEAEFFGF